MPWGVGVIGAGPGVAALHLPTLAMLSDLFRVVHVSRPRQRPRSASSPRRLGATASQGTAELLADPAVEVVVICSPPERARSPDPGVRRRGRACDPLREAVRDHEGRGAGGRRSVPRGRCRRSSWRPTTSTTRHGIARSTISWPCSPTCARSRRRWPCRRTAATTPRSPSSPQQARRVAGAPDLADPGIAAPRSCGSSCSGSRCTTSRPCATWRPTSRASTSPPPSRRSATRSASVPAACACC